MELRKTSNIFLLLWLAKKYPFDKQENYDRIRDVIKHQKKLMFQDIFSPIWCSIVGHKKYNINKEGNPDDFACNRCCHFL